MDKNRFLELLQKCRSGAATEEEREWVDAYYDQFEDEPGLEKLSPEEINQLKERVRQGTWAIIGSQTSQKTGRIRRLIPRPLRVAAAIAALVATGLLFYTVGKRKPVSTEISRINQVNKKGLIQPGGNKAILTLANGQEVVLNNTSGATLIHQGGADVLNQKKGELVYKASDLPQNEEIKPGYNTITTPMGGQFKIALSDGTEVWLNAGSSLRYPVTFTGDQRQVWLSGEAYFEVAKQQGKSFLVEAAGSEVQVLGTHFNVNAYGDEAMVRTTLAEGAVKVSGSGSSKILKPGDQASFNNQNGQIKIAAADVDMALAWTRDLFLFDNTNIENIMRDVSRWYDVKVVYETKNLENKNFSGVMSRYVEVSSLLQRLELTGGVHFTIDGKSITVTD